MIKALPLKYDSGHNSSKAGSYINDCSSRFDDTTEAEKNKINIENLKKIKE